MAQDVTFMQSVGVGTANWIGVGDNVGEFIQGGFMRENSNVWGCGNYGGSKKPYYFSEVQESGTYLAPYCYFGYDFSGGSQWDNELSWTGSTAQTWEAWLYFDGAWQRMITAGFSGTKLGKDTKAWPSVAFEEVRSSSGDAWPDILAQDNDIRLSPKFGASFEYWTASDEPLNNQYEHLPNIKLVVDVAYHRLTFKGS